MSGAFKGEFVKLLMALNETVERMQVIVLEIRRSSEDIAGGVSKMGPKLCELSLRSNAQAASVEDTNASVKTPSTTMRATT